MSFAGIKSIRDICILQAAAMTTITSVTNLILMMRMKMTSDRRNVGHSDDESDEMFLSMTVDCE